REVAEALGRALRTRIREQRRLTAEELDRLEKVRHTLNEYVLALHEERRPLGRTAYEALGRLAQLSEAPSYAGPKLDSTNSTGSDFNRLRALFDVLAQRW